MSTASSVCIGSAVGMLAASGWTLNVMTAIAILKGRFLSAGGNVTYPMLLNLLLSDTIHLSLILFYLTPAAIVQVYFHAVKAIC